MAKKKSITRNQNHDVDASSRKRVKTCDNSGVGPWSDHYYPALYLVMMELGFVDYHSFSRVCKSWRSLAFSEREIFMASKTPMTIRISWYLNNKICYLEDFEGRKFETFLPPCQSGVCVGLTCGYLIFFTRTTREFCLVNPIARHHLSFTDSPFNNSFSNCDHFGMKEINAILVFSLSICGWVFLIMLKSSNQIWYSVAGTGVWDYVSSTSLFTDLLAFKGIIYVLNLNPQSNLCELYQLQLNPDNPKLTLVKTKNSLEPSHAQQLVSSGEYIYVMDCIPKDRYRFQELDLSEMKWVSREKTIGECASFLSNLKHGVVVKPELSKNHGEVLLLGHNSGDMLKKIQVEKTLSSFTVNMWYFPHECLNVDFIDE